MTGVAVPVYAGIVVSDVVDSASWYERTLPCEVVESGRGWVSLAFPDRTTIELFQGDPRRPGETFPSYVGEQGPAVMPGYAVDEPELVVADLTIARSLPDWHVVVAPDGLRVVVTTREVGEGPGLVGFGFRSPLESAQRAFLAGLGVVDVVESGGCATVVPRVAGDRSGRLTDPDGTPIEFVAKAATLGPVD